MTIAIDNSSEHKLDSSKMNQDNKVVKRLITYKNWSFIMLKIRKIKQKILNNYYKKRENIIKINYPVRKHNIKKNLKKNINLLNIMLWKKKKDEKIKKEKEKIKDEVSVLKTYWKIKSLWYW